MEEQSLALSFSNSITNKISDILVEYAELGLDALGEEGVLKEIPIISTVMSIYGIGKSIRERHHMAKLISFLDEINKCICDENKRQEYRSKFYSNVKFRNKELEYILILVDRYISLDKPKILAKLYLAYLDEKIIWKEFTIYAEIIDRFIVLDYDTLITEAEKIIIHRNMGGESVLRLVAFGLMMEVMDTSLFAERDDGSLGITHRTLSSSISTDKIYKRTEFGEKLANILR